MATSDSAEWERQINDFRRRLAELERLILRKIAAEESQKGESRHGD